MTILVSEDWEKFPSVRLWKRNLISKNHNKELKAWESRKSYFKRYMKFTGKNPDELIQIAKDDNLEARDSIDEFYHELCKTLQKSSARTASYGMIRGFYSNNGIITQGWSSPKLSVLQSHITDERNPIFIKTENRFELNKKFLREYFDVLDFRTKVIAMCMLSSSLDISEILNLKIGDIIHQKEDRIYLVGQRSKTGEIYKTFFSKETTQFLRDYIKKERSDSRDDEVVFIAGRRQLSREYTRITGKLLYHNESKIASFPILKPLSHENIDTLFRRATKKLDVQLRKGQAQPFRPKRFRHTFIQCCSRSGIPQTVIDTFTGHKGSMNKQYETESRFELEDYFEQVEPMLTIYEDISQNSKILELEKKIIELQEKKTSVADFGEEMLERIRKLEQENLVLKEKL